MICSVCGASNDNESLFCSKCGSKLNCIDENEIKDEYNIFTETDSDNNIRATEKKSSYILKHWRGEYSLSKSFWLNLVVVSIAVELIIVLLSKLPFFNFTQNEHAPYMLVALLVVTLCIRIWSVIGVFRSAKKNTLFSIVAVVVSGASLFTATISTIDLSKTLLKISNNSDVPPYTVKVLNNGNELLISGGIRYGMTKTVIEYFNKYPNIKIIHLDSPGGRFLEAKYLADYLENKNITTYTSTNCSSACIDIFMSGANRIIGNGGKLGFQKSSIIGSYENYEYDNSLDLKKQNYINKGVKAEFVSKVFNIENNDIWYPANSELKKNGVITGINK